MTITASTPGRICLFGEHQDYLGLPVIAAAISRRVGVQVTQTPTPTLQISLPDVGSHETIPLVGLPLPYQHSRDYYRAGLNVLGQEGFTFSRGGNVEVRGNIPINSGTSSSSALLISWLHVLTHLADQPHPLTPERLAELAYRAEVLEFGDPGGMMDHYATAVGGVIYLESQPAVSLQKLQPVLGQFVLGDSLEPKDTIGILKRVKLGMLDILRRLNSVNPLFTLSSASLADAAEYRDLLTKAEYILLQGNLTNRDILREALAVLTTPSLDHTRFGQLLTDHQTNLREAQRISTPKIDRMLDAALSVGALGGKINGSGGGGCMFAYAPERAEAVAEAIEREGGRAYIVTIDAGTQLHEGAAGN